MIQKTGSSKSNSTGFSIAESSKYGTLQKWLHYYVLKM